MQKLLIYANDFEILEKTQRVYEKHLNNPIEICMDEPGLMAQVDSRNFSLGIFTVLEADGNIFSLTNRLRNSGYTFPLLILSEKMDTALIRKVEGLSDVHTLIGKPTEKAMIGLARKLLMARRVPKQTFPRFNTNVIAQIESLASGNAILTCMYNLSQGGAYCEFEGQDGITVGDLIKFRVNLNTTNSDYSLNGKVVWTTPKGRFSGRFGCGFKFVSTQDTYRALISKL